MVGMTYSKFMSGTDALMHAAETNPHLRTSGVGLFFLASAPDPALIRDRFDRLSRLAPRFRQRVLEVPFSSSPPRFLVDPDFDLDYHVRFVGVPPGGGLRELLDFVQVQQVQDLDKHRPQWEVTVVTGLPEDRAALVFKSSHAITDAVGGLAMLGSLFDLDREAPDLGPLPEAPEPEHLTTADLLREVTSSERTYVGGLTRSISGGAGALARDPMGAVRRSVDAVRSIGRVMVGAPFSSPIMTERSLVVRCDIVRRPLDDLKAAGKAAGGSLNDAFVAAICGGMRLYHERHGAPVNELRMAMPINIRTAADTQDVAGNQFVVGKFDIPVGESDPARRIEEIRDRSAALRSEPGLRLFTPLAEVITRLPGPLLVPLFRKTLAAGIDVGTSNVPGPPFPLYLAGARIDSILLYGPIATVATNCTLLSYDGDVHVAVQVNKAAIPDGEVFTECLEAGFDEVLALARRRKPTRKRLAS